MLLAISFCLVWLVCHLVHIHQSSSLCPNPPHSLIFVFALKSYYQGLLSTLCLRTVKRLRLACVRTSKPWILIAIILSLTCLTFLPVVWYMQTYFGTDVDVMKGGEGLWKDLCRSGRGCGVRGFVYSRCGSWWNNSLVYSQPTTSGLDSQ